MTFFLIGFMGSGKTHWGQLWADKYGFNFIDLDAVVEKLEGKKIAAIFEINGEDYFRKIESAALKNLVEVENTIIACGGGTPCFYENLNWMNKMGTTIYLSSTPNQILERVLEEQEKRPLLKTMNQGELLFFIEQKLKERAIFYNAASLIFPSDGLTENLFGEILSSKQLSQK